MTSDGELLRHYAEAASEEAFGELVGRHVDLVYSAALRQANGDAHLAQDIAQSVFTDLARKAASLSDRPVLAGWLYTSTHYAAAKAVRTEQRRHTREQEAQAMQELLHDPGPNLDWEKLRPVLDTAMHELSEPDREVILMRYFENCQHGEIGAKIGLSENAARMRVERALEKLREDLSRRGMSTADGTLAVVISANAVQAAPVGLAVTISTAAALAGTTLATTATATATKAIAMTTLQKTLITVAVVGSVTTSLLLQQHRLAKASEADQLAQQQSSQLARLKTDNDRLSSLVASAGNPNNLGELQRLREEAAALRQKTNGLAALEKDRQELNRTLAKARQDSQDSNVQHSVWSEDANGKAKYAGQLAQTLQDFAAQHQNQFPTNFDQVAAFVSARAGNDTGFTPDQFEIVYHGSTDTLAKYANPGLIFLARERQPWKNTDGKWTKIYLTMTGVELISVADGDFEAFEKKHILPPESSKP